MEIAELLEVPIVGAPLAGGAGTPALAAAVSDAGGLGFLAAGYKSAAVVREEIATVRARTARPFGLNLFFPVRENVSREALRSYAATLSGEEERYGSGAASRVGATTAGTRSSRSSSRSAHASSPSRSAAPTASSSRSCGAAGRACGSR